MLSHRDTQRSRFKIKNKREETTLQFYLHVKQKWLIDSYSYIINLFIQTNNCSLVLNLDQLLIGKVLFYLSFFMFDLLILVKFTRLWSNLNTKTSIKKKLTIIVIICNYTNRIIKRIRWFHANKNNYNRSI